MRQQSRSECSDGPRDEGWHHPPLGTCMRPEAATESFNWWSRGRGLEEPGCPSGGCARQMQIHSPAAPAQQPHLHGEFLSAASQQRHSSDPGSKQLLRPAQPHLHGYSLSAASAQRHSSAPGSKQLLRPAPSQRTQRHAHQQQQRPPAPTSGMTAALSLSRSERERGEGTA